MKRATQTAARGGDEPGISIHALVKRATIVQCILACIIAISIHALVKRATEIHGIIKNNEIISIHALVKRATSSFASVIISSNYFNPRPRKEGDVLHPLLNL